MKKLLNWFLNLFKTKDMLTNYELSELNDKMKHIKERIRVINQDDNFHDNKKEYEWLFGLLDATMFRIEKLLETHK